MTIKPRLKDPMSPIVYMCDYISPHCTHFKSDILDWLSYMNKTFIFLLFIYMVTFMLTIKYNSMQLCILLWISADLKYSKIYFVTQCDLKLQPKVEATLILTQSAHGGSISPPPPHDPTFSCVSCASFKMYQHGARHPWLMTTYTIEHVAPLHCAAPCKWNKNMKALLYSPTAITLETL